MRLIGAIKKRRNKIVGFALLAVVLFVLISYICAVAWDNYNYPFNLNPAPPPTSFIVPMMIPPAITNATFPWPDLYLGISVRANGTIAEGVEVELATATAVIASHDYYLRLDGVQVFFQESVAWRFKNSTTPRDLTGYVGWPAGIVFQRDMTDLSNQNLLPYVNKQDIFFPAAGDYSPTVLVIFQHDKPIEYTYDAIKIHVASSSDIQNARFTRVNTALTYALVLFAVIESIAIMRDFTEDKPKCHYFQYQASFSTPASPPINANPTTQITSPDTNNHQSN